MQKCQSYFKLLYRRFFPAQYLIVKDYSDYAIVTICWKFKRNSLQLIHLFSILMQKTKTSYYKKLENSILQSKFQQNMADNKICCDTLHHCHCMLSCSYLVYNRSTKLIECYQSMWTSILNRLRKVVFRPLDGLFQSIAQT